MLMRNLYLMIVIYFGVFGAIDIVIGKPEIDYKIRCEFRLEFIALNDALRELRNKFVDRGFKFERIGAGESKIISWSTSNSSENVEILSFVSVLDMPVGLRGSEIFYNVKFVEPEALRKLLYQSRNQWSDKFVIISDPDNRRLFLMGNREEIIHVNNLLYKLDVDNGPPGSVPQNKKSPPALAPDHGGTVLPSEGH
jgi:hypothetical protein